MCLNGKSICMLKKFILDKKYAILVILLVIFYSPAFYFWAENLSTKDKVFGWMTCICLSVVLFAISCFVSGKKEKIYLTTIFILALVPNAIVWSYLYLSNTYMCKDMYWVIFNSNIHESAEYFSSFIGWTPIITTACYVVIGALLLFAPASKLTLSIQKHKSLFISSLLTLVSH